VRAPPNLADCPRWDAAAGRLFWVDIEGCKLHVLESGEDRAIGFDAMVGAAAPTSGGAVLVALAGRLALLDLDHESGRTLVHRPAGPPPICPPGRCAPPPPPPTAPPYGQTTAPATPPVASGSARWGSTARP